MSAKNWPVAEGFAGWAQNQEKRMMHEERRPLVRTASDLLGPGLAPHAVELFDWNSDEAAFNGLFYSTTMVANSPDNTLYWMGQTVGTSDGFGIQYLWEYRHVTDPAQPIHEYIRRFYDPGGGGLRAYSPWVPRFNMQTVPRARLVNSLATQTILNNTTTTVNLTADYAFDMTADTVTDSLTVNADGIYNITAACNLGAVAPAGRRIMDVVSGGVVMLRTEIPGASGSDAARLIAGDIHLTALSTVILQVHQTSGLSMTLENVSFPAHLSMRRVADIVL